MSRFSQNPENPVKVTLIYFNRPLRWGILRKLAWKSLGRRSPGLFLFLRGMPRV